MDLPTRSARERAAHYEREAEKFRRMAEVEPTEYIRLQLRTLSDQYQQLATSLRENRPIYGPTEGPDG